MWLARAFRAPAAAAELDERSGVLLRPLVGWGIKAASVNLCTASEAVALARDGFAPFALRIPVDDRELRSRPGRS
jgi:hypothetical protein